jgi:hypothetical protein
MVELDSELRSVSYKVSTRLYQSRASTAVESAVFQLFRVDIAGTDVRTGDYCAV